MVLALYSRHLLAEVNTAAEVDSVDVGDDVDDGDGDVILLDLHIGQSINRSIKQFN